MNGAGRSWWWPVGLAFLLLVGVLGFFAFGPSGWLDRGDKLGSVGGLVVGAAALLVSVVALRWRSGASSAVVLLDRATVDLCEQVGRQWSREKALRLLDRPQPLAVRWSSTQRAVSPSPDEVLVGAVGGRPTRLRLRGDVTDVAAAFAKLPAQQLVILGQPGAGKSVLAMLLTLGLLERRRAGEPVPVLLSISSWRLHEPLEAWLARRIVEDYPFLADRGVYGVDAVIGLVRSGRVLPILDGLDEMPTQRQAPALAALNDTISGGRPVVLTCRSEQYQAAVAVAGAPLGRAAVVEIEPVTAGDAARYLPAGQLDGRARWAPVLDHLTRHPDGPVAAALSTPLMVYLVRTMYAVPGTDPAQLCDQDRFTSRLTIEHHLLNGFLPAVYDTRSELVATGRKYRLTHVRRWLGFLAGHLDRLGSQELAWWQLPAAVKGWWVLFAWALTVGAVVVFAAMDAITLAFGGYGLSFGDVSSLPLKALIESVTMVGNYGLVLGLVVGLAASRAASDRPVGDAHRARRVQLLRALAAGLGYAVVFMPAAFTIADFSDYSGWVGSDVVSAGFRGVGFGLLILLIPAGFGPAVGRRSPRPVAWVGQWLLVGVGVGLIDSMWPLLAQNLYPVVGPGFSLVAGLTVVRMAPKVQSGFASRIRALLGRGLRGLIAAVALGLTGPFNGDIGLIVVVLMFAVAVGIGVAPGPVGDGRGGGTPVSKWSRTWPPSALQALAMGLVFASASTNLFADWPVASIFGLVAFAVCLVPSRPEPGPDRSIRPRTRKLWRSIREGAWAGLASGLVFAIAILMDGSAREAMIWGGVAGLVVGVAVGFVAGLATPASHRELVDPRSALRGDRAAVMAAVLVTGFLFVLIGIIGVSSLLGFVFGFLAILVLALRSRWLEYTVARTYLALAGKLPWAPIRFLADAHKRGVLRQIGAMYQLRHTRLQELLTTRRT